MSVVIETTLGDITVDLFITQRAQTCKNFLKLCAIKYYNSCSFHFVQRDFIAQTGDPTGTGTGGECVYARVPGSAGNFILGEKKPKIKHDRFGLISMVNSGDSGHGSQFFFTLCDSLEYLDGMHTVFGTVVEGQDVLVKLNDTICDEKQRPYQDILITHTVVLDDPFPDIDGLVIPPSSPEYNFEELIASDRIGVGEAIVDEDKPLEVLEEEIRDKDAKQRALVLEMIGDLPDADVAPPENVLFVCKLNPVTRDEDLEIIFSRFGTIVSCEIIKDERSGESLQYGFIEFEKEEDCEKAFFKMDNVLIDDRRIHVDFSQSVTKIKWRGKGRGVIHVKDNDANGSRNGKNGHKRRSYEREIATGHGNYRNNQNDYRNPKPSSRQDRTDSRREIEDSRKHVDSRSRKRSRSRDRDSDRDYDRNRDRDHHHHSSTSSSRHHTSSRKVQASSSSSKPSRSKHHHDDDYDRKDRGRSDRDYHHKSSSSKYHKR